MIFADFECTQEDPDPDMEDGTLSHHKVILAVALRISKSCQDTWDKDLDYCSHCKGPHQQIFEGEDALKNFLEYVLEAPAGTVCFFHNLKGYFNKTW